MRSLQCQLKKFDCSILNVTKRKFIQSPSLFFFLLHSIVWKVSPSKRFEALFPRMLKRNPTDWKIRRIIPLNCLRVFFFQFLWELECMFVWGMFCCQVSLNQGNVVHACLLIACLKTAGRKTCCDMLNGRWRQRGTTSNRRGTDIENGSDVSDTYPVSATSMQRAKGKNRKGKKKQLWQRK